MHTSANAADAPTSTGDAVADLSDRMAVVCLLLVLALYLGLRVPVIYLQPGGQDEDVYAVPGLTILASGIPRLPNAPARNPESVFYLADVALFAEPPLYFYWQALFYAVLPDVYGTARLSSVVAGLISLVTLFWIGRHLSGRNALGLMAACLFSFSRWFYFGAIAARPDQLCGAFGLLALAAVLKSCSDATATSRNARWLVAAGVCIGLGGLTHVLAITYAIPLGLWVAGTETTWKYRLRSFGIITGVAVGVACLWLPLILAFPEPFRVQFHNQFVVGTGDSLLRRFLWPWAGIAYQTRGMTQFMGWPQSLLLAGGLTVCGWYSWRRGQRDWLWTIFTAALCIYLLFVCLGTSHLGLGYWVVPAGVAYLCVASLAVRIASRASLPAWSRAYVAAGVFCLLMAVHLPGSGVRALVVYWQHRHELAYNAPRFAQELMRDIPRDARCSVDAQFALDFLASGRPTVNLQSIPRYFLTQHHPFDYMIVSRFGMAEGTAALVRGRLVKTVGVRDDPFACYAEIYLPPLPDGETSSATAP